MTKKAYVLSADYEDYTSLVYAESRNQARMIGLESGESTYIETGAKREPRADQWAGEGHLREYDCGRLRELGWWCEEGHPCDRCGLWDWGDKPEWEICSECNQCGECGHEDDCNSGRALSHDQAQIEQTSKS